MVQNPENEIKKGTTTVGLTCKDGVVLATEQRATMGTLIAHKSTQKLFGVADNIGLTIAGGVGDAQALTRYITAEAALYSLKRNGVNMSVKAAATLTANILSGRGYYPYWVQLILGGVDNEGAHVYSLDMAGGSIEDLYTATGSGSPYAFGVLEDHYRPGMTLKDTVDLAITAISMAMRRDAASGNGILVATVTPDKGFQEMKKEDIDKRINILKVE